MKQSILRECIRIALEKLSNHTLHYKHFSFVIHRNKIVEMAVNNKKIPPLHYGYHTRVGGKPMTHAEVAAWKKARGLIGSDSFEMVNIRLNNVGEWKMSCPCDVCQTILQAVGCKKVYYTTESGWKEVKF